jgi:hypothetical protein
VALSVGAQLVELTRQDAIGAAEHRFHRVLLEQAHAVCGRKMVRLHRNSIDVANIAIALITPDRADSQSALYGLASTIITSGLTILREQLSKLQCGLHIDG